MAYYELENLGNGARGVVSVPSTTKGATGYTQGGVFTPYPQNSGIQTTGTTISNLMSSPWLWLGLFGLISAGIVLFVKPKKKILNVSQ